MVQADIVMPDKQEVDSSSLPPLVEGLKTTPEERFVRLDLPSHFIPYANKELFVRPFKVSSIIRLSHARDGGATVVIDEVGKVMRGLDVRDLTIGDFTYVLAWLRINSYHRSPYKVVYTSKYGNENELTVDATNLKTEELHLSQADYNDACAKGFNIPRVRDMEQQTEDKAELELANWLYAAPAVSLRGRADKILNDEVELEWLEGLSEWKNKCKHGVMESIKAVDSKFEPSKYIKLLEQKIKDYNHDAQMLAQVGRGAEAIILNREAQMAEEELVSITAKLEQGKEVRAEEETIEFQISAASFLSFL